MDFFIVEGFYLILFSVFYLVCCVTDLFCDVQEKTWCQIIGCLRMEMMSLNSCLYGDLGKRCRHWVALSRR